MPTNRHESTNTNRNEPRGHGTGKWKRTAGTEPKFCGNRTEHHSYIWIWYVELCENNYLSIYFLIPSFPSFSGLRITALPNSFGLEISLFQWKDWANTVIPNTHVVYSTVRSRNPPRDTFGRKRCFPGVAGNEYSRTALASKFTVAMERLSKYCNPQYPCSILNGTIPQPP